MRSEFLELLQCYFHKYGESRPSHPVLIEAASDYGMATLDLVKLAQEFVREKREDSQANENSQEIAIPSWTRSSEINFPLLILQQRVNRETIEAAFNLLLLAEPEGRQLGVQILREFQTPDTAPRAHSQEIVNHLQQMLEVEKDELVLAWALSAIGWQCLPEGTRALLPFVGHEDEAIRLVVADNILNGFIVSKEISQPALDGIVRLIQDDCPEVQWSILYDMAEQPELFASSVDVVKQAVLLASGEWAEKVQEQAQRVILALRG